MLLTPAQTRDVVAYLASLTGDDQIAADNSGVTVADLVGAGSVAGIQPAATTRSGGKRIGVMLLPAAAYIVVLVPVILWLVLRLRGNKSV